MYVYKDSVHNLTSVSLGVMGLTAQAVLRCYNLFVDVCHAQFVSTLQQASAKHTPYGIAATRALFVFTWQDGQTTSPNHNSPHVLC